jgi:protocatechuate 3,4-dioxygenase beta subunit
MAPSERLPSLPADADGTALTRRQVLLGGLTAAGAVALATACASSPPTGTAAPASSTSTSSTSSTTATAAGGTIPSMSCVVTPEQMEGPFYLDTALDRRDITEGRPGAPLELELVIADATRCVPLPGVAVDIWHCDAMGVYSGYEGAVVNAAHVEPVTTHRFFRGTQVTDANGRCAFTTIVPGWYTGRAVHIHVKAHPTATSQATTQLYFPEDTLAVVFAADPYRQHAGAHVPFDQDSIYLAAKGPAPLTLTKTASGYAASFTMGIAT